MYGQWEGELWFHRWHMWPVPSSSTPSVAPPVSSFVFIDSNSFSKDGRKINVGDCALFKPPYNSLPFVGRIRKLKLGKENNISLCVNWLYRPADVKLKEGASVKAAPNEIFYSFHKDEIPAASLLHPCKVTFLGKGVEFPSGVSSFVCRQVYDVEVGCLFWLTDRNYVNSCLTQELQAEVDQLLNKMHRSPKPLIENLQNSSSSISSHAKSKKRKHNGHNSESLKRERLSKVDDADSGQVKSEQILKDEILKITDKGGLVDVNGVEKLIKLMRPEKKLNLGCRTMLVDVISGTDRFDCLGRFARLKGLLVLDEWLQEIHKGKIGDASFKENDKSVERFLFSLLRAFDKLPVNLHALQTCNVGKSVNLLRSHKNSEIQKKARSLVSTWKRRVEAEMNIIETNKGGPCPHKPVISEVGPKTFTSQPKQSSPGSTSATKEGSSQSCSSDHGKTGASSVSHGKNLGNGFNGVNKEVGILPKITTKRLIVRLPNTGQSPTKNASLESPENNVPNTNMGDDLSRVKAAIEFGEEHGKKDASSPKPGNKVHEECYSSMNALVESCAEIYEASVSPPIGDVGGINLLASVAAGEISRSADVSPPCSPDCDSPVSEKDAKLVEDAESRGPLEEDKCPHDKPVVGPLDAAATSVKLETNEDPASCSSSDMEKDDKALVVSSETDCVEDRIVKLDFDLNEVFPSDDVAEKVDVHAPSPPVTVTAAAKGPFYPSESLSRGKPELGWKGSAATSAFRPAEPRKVDVPEVDSRSTRPLFDFDLNVDAGQQNAPSGFDLDLNACETPEVDSRSTLPGFDLNGPGMEEMVTYSKNSMPFMPSLPNIRTNNMFPPVTASSSLNPEIFRAPVLSSSSPAVTPFQFSPFSFETGFSIPSVSNAYLGSPNPICFPGVPSVRPNGVVSVPYYMSLPADGRKWGSQGLDLNAGPGGPDEQLRMIHQLAAGGGGGGASKRKEPDGGWDGDNIINRISYKHPHRQ